MCTLFYAKLLLRQMRIDREKCGKMFNEILGKCGKLKVLVNFYINSFETDISMKKLL